MADTVGGERVSRETRDLLLKFSKAVVDENRRQNLISKASEGEIWQRHIEDSAQLLRFARTPNGAWLDLGSGPGFPGLVVGIMRKTTVWLTEERARRRSFLESQVKALRLGHVHVHNGKVETLALDAVAVISARAFAPLSRLLPLAVRFSTPETIWILPKGKSAAEELASVRDAWHGDFRIEPSLTDPQCGIIVATDVRRKGSR